MASLLQDEWRGLAHFRTESRRRVFKKTPGDRTASELYVLEEVFSDVKLISNLPFSKRLEICKFIHYQLLDENKIVYKEGEVDNMFYVIFTGSVKVTATFGRKQKLLNTLYAGDYFGEASFHESNVRRETVTTLRRTELLTLSKEDYERVLKIDITDEVRANFNVLKNVKILDKISNASMFRLAGLLTFRVFPKNRVITFQGDEAREMFFIKSGECRVVMAVTSPEEAFPRLLPRAASSLSQYRPTTHDHCKKVIKEVRKNWGHPHCSSRSSRRPISRSRSVPPLRLNAWKQTTGSDHPSSSSSSSSSSTISNDERPSTAPDELELKIGCETAATAAEKKCVTPPRHRQQQQGHPKYGHHQRLSATSSSSALRPKSVMHSSHSARRRTVVQISKGGEIEAKEKENSAPNSNFRQSVVRHPKQRKTLLPRLPSLLRRKHEEEKEEEEMGRKKTVLSSTEGRLRSITPTSRRSTRPYSEMSMRSYRAKRLKSLNCKTYSLKSLLSEINHKFADDSIQDLEFSDKEALLWGMGTSDTGFHRGDVSDPIQYQTSFQQWARKVIIRERKLQLAEANSDSDSKLSSSSTSSEFKPLFVPPLHDPALEGDKLLDVGGLHGGEFFGEVALLRKSRITASILTVTEVEVLALTKSDFFRRLDKDILECISSNDYKKTEYMHQHYNKTFRWAVMKKKIMKDTLLMKRERFPNRFHHDMLDALRRNATPIV